VIGAVVFVAKYIQGNVNITDVGIKWSVCIYAFISVYISRTGQRDKDGDECESVTGNTGFYS
jgi:hypothetical protein